MDTMLRRRLMMQPKGGGRLPYGLKEVEYVENVPKYSYYAACVDSGLMYKSDFDEYEGDLCLFGEGYFFGAGRAGGSSIFLRVDKGGRISCQNGWREEFTEIVIPFNTRFSVHLTTQDCTIGGSSFTHSMTPSSTNTVSILGSYSKTSYTANGCIYTSHFKLQGSSVMDLIPARTTRAGILDRDGHELSIGAGCLYDEVSGDILGCYDKSKELITGPDVN